MTAPQSPTNLTAELRELSETLYRLSGGWGAELQQFYHPDTGEVITPRTSYETQVAVIPDYPLDYLLDKLPKKTVIKRAIYGLVLTPSTSDGSWIADYYSVGWDYFDDKRWRSNWLHHGDKAKLTEADTLKCAVLKLACELLRAGVLRRGES